ncbi:hypothetical protein Ddye_007270 [Dipteronia dyeriana]|uniref:DUF659 domain-containing protein n=1 Tax=Dipteronia dyeriana TaxID=168575 RepID=A0AAD9XK94_9ROSI|nr:hypothetical protein Ddye_007270 [Dipteronia dyeriana]
MYVNIGVGVQPPSTFEIRHKYSNTGYKEIKEYVDNFKTKWEKYGCTVMCDGWTGSTRLSIIDFMVYCKCHTIFLKFVDASDKIKDHQYIYGFIKYVVKEVSEKNVVQIVTDNSSAFVKAGSPDPQIASHARDMRINVEQVIREEFGVDRRITVRCSSDDQHTYDKKILMQEVGMLVQQVGMFVPEVGMLVQHDGILVRQVGMLMQVILIKIVVDNMEEQVKLMKIL